MKTPRKPPSWQQILQEVQNTEKWGFIFSLQNEEGYKHWDEIRHRPPPEGLTREQWWLSLKTKRLSQYREVFLKDKEGASFQFLIPDFVQKLLHDIDLKAGGSIGMSEQMTNEQERNRYLVRSLMQEAITSSQLEGAVATRSAAKEMLRSGRAPVDKSERMILNNYLTMRHLEKIKNKDLTPEIILEIHRLVTKDTLDNASKAGCCRENSDCVDIYDEEDDQILHSPPQAFELPKRMQDLCDFANGSSDDKAGFIHPVVRAIIVHFALAYDHPFVDGNGRTARALFYWCMLRYGYWLFEYISISSILLEAPKQYARSFLYTETDDNDLTYFIVYQTEVIERAVKALMEYVDRKSEDYKKSLNELRSLNYLNHRQRVLVQHALKHPYQQYTIESHQHSHQIIYNTARNDLLKLEKEGLLTKEKVGKVYYYSAVEDLEDKLR